MVSEAGRFFTVSGLIIRQCYSINADSIIISDWLRQSFRNASEENKYCIVIQQLRYYLIRMRDGMTTVTIL
jgi:hypothetical protein